MHNWITGNFVFPKPIRGFAFALRLDAMVVAVGFMHTHVLFYGFGDFGFVGFNFDSA